MRETVCVGRRMCLLVLCCVIFVAGARAGEGRWPAGKSPEEIGRRAAEFTVANQLGTLLYANVCCAYGVLKFAGAVDDSALRQRVEAIYEPHLTGSKKNERHTGQSGVVTQWFGFVPWELYEQTGRRDYLELGKQYADEQFADPRPDGLPGYTRLWVDDMYGVGCLQGLACQYLEEPVYADRGTLTLLVHAKKLQQPNGLYLHAGEKGPFFWGRGNGWAAAGMAELLARIPADHPRAAGVPGQDNWHTTLLPLYKKQMQGLLECQDTSGAWRQLLDYPDAWIETSGTAMFVFALATGVREGWLPADPYLEATRRGWLALAERVDEQGRLEDVCVGTGRRMSAEKYLGRPRVPGDPHGQAPLLWAAAAMIRLEEAPWIEGNRKGTPTDYLQVVKDYADTMIQHGRDTYGIEHSPLFAATLDRKTLRMFPREEREALWRIRFDDFPNLRLRNRDRCLDGANPQHEEDLYQVLYALTEITGDLNYARQADRTIKWFLQRCQSPVTGLLAWGEHMGWDFDTETIIWKPSLHNGAILLECITHEYLKPWILWERSFDVAPRASERFALGLWEHQIHDHQTGTFSRHAVYTRHRTWPDSEFPRHGGFYLAAWAEAYKRTKKPVFARALETLVEHFERNRSPQSGIIPAVSPGDTAWAFSNFSLAIDLSDGAGKVEPPLAEKMRQCARRTDEILLKLPHDLTPGGQGFLSTVDFHTLEPKAGAWSGRGNGREAGIVNICMIRYRQTGNEGYRKLVLAAAVTYLTSEFDFEFAVDPSGFASVIWLLLNAHELTGEQQYLERADYFGQQALELFFDDGSPLPRINTKYTHYEAVTGADTLAMALLKLWVVKNRPEADVKLTCSGR